MDYEQITMTPRQVIIHAEGAVCLSKRDIVSSGAFEEVFARYIEKLRSQDSPLLERLGIHPRENHDHEQCVRTLLELLRSVSEHPLNEVAKTPRFSAYLQSDRRVRALHELTEGLYDFWRTFSRFMILHSEIGASAFDRRPYRSFNRTIEALTELVRSAYRDVCENITGDHPRVFRQIAAGCNAGMIAVPKETRLPGPYQDALKDISFIRQVWIAPPMIIDPPSNKRSGRFARIGQNPLSGLALEKGKWLCYPAQVGPLVLFVYFHQEYMGMGCALANLFELATDEQIARGPDGIYVFGAQADEITPDSGLRSGAWEEATVFHEDEGSGLFVALVPGEERFGYFGYLKKMVLTLHNAIMLKRGRMPFHGAMVRILLKNRRIANILLIGDTATGKSESLEAFRQLGRDRISEMRIIADDMGSLEIGATGEVIGYGTEIGAFIRLDDLDQGYAFSQIDRAVFMSPHKTNARVVIPITTLEDVLHGYPLDFLLYANNYEQVDGEHPVLEIFQNAERAFEVFRQGSAMSKGTTSSSGLVHSYFANVFGPPEYRELHDQIASRVFQSAYKSGVVIGQLRTRLGIPGYEKQGPLEAARALLERMGSKGRDSGGWHRESC